MSRFSTIIASAFVLSACFPFDAGEHRIDDQYYLWAPDVRSQMALYFRLAEDDGVGRIESTVFAAGADERHVIAKRHPGGVAGVTEYFIVDRTRDRDIARPSEVVAGPFTAAEFIAARRRLGVDPSLDFTVVLRDLQ